MKHRGMFAASVAAILASPATVAAAAPCRLADLHWMAGAWRDDSAATQSEERWIVGPDDRLMGSSWSLHPGAGGGVVEAETIQANGADIVLRLRHFSGDLTLAREEKDAPMLFAAASCADRSIVFDGQGPRAGEHITYRRAGDTLTFIGDFIHQGQPLRVAIDFKKSGD
jgi:hypothetical protein